MERLIKNTFYTTWGILLLGLNTVNAAINFWKDDVKESLKGDTETADSTIQVLITNVMVFLGIIAVCYLLWWGFNILTAGWDENKVKTWKTVIIQAWIWLVVIYLANSIVQWVISSILKST